MTAGLIPEVRDVVDELWILVAGGVRRWPVWLARLVARQDGWAPPFGDFNHRWLSALFRPMRPVKDLAQRDAGWATRSTPPSPTSRSALLLGASSSTSSASRPRPTSRSSATSCSCSAAAVTGAADYADTDGTARTRATLHATLMVVALVLLLVSLGDAGRRAADRTDRRRPRRSSAS